MPTLDDYLHTLPSPTLPLDLDTSCPICHEPFTDPVELPCMGAHIFCRDCVQAWLETANTCPLDRQVLVEYDDDEDDEDDEEGDTTPNSHESSDAQTPPHLLASSANERHKQMTTISLKIAFCRGIMHAVTQRGGDWADRMQGALDRIRDKVEGGSCFFENGGVVGWIDGLVEVDGLVDEAVGVVDGAPVDDGGSGRGRGRGRVGRELREVRGLILNAMARGVGL